MHALFYVQLLLVPPERHQCVAELLTLRRVKELEAGVPAMQLLHHSSADPHLILCDGRVGRPQLGRAILAFRTEVRPLSLHQCLLLAENLYLVLAIQVVSLLSSRSS